MPATALTAVVKPFQRLRELHVQDIPLSAAEVAELRGQLPCLEDLVHTPAGQYEEMVRSSLQLRTINGLNPHSKWWRKPRAREQAANCTLTGTQEVSIRAHVLSQSCEAHVSTSVFALRSSRLLVDGS